MIPVLYPCPALPCPALPCPANVTGRVRINTLLNTYSSVITLVVQVQDEAAGLVVALLDPHPGEAILDACAAPGGKALYAATRMEAQVPALAFSRSWMYSILVLLQ